MKLIELHLKLRKLGKQQPCKWTFFKNDCLNHYGVHPETAGEFDVVDDYFAEHWIEEFGGDK